MALSTVDPPRCHIGHQREVARNSLVLDLAGLLVQRTGDRAEGSVGHVALLALPLMPSWLLAFQTESRSSAPGCSVVLQWVPECVNGGTSFRPSSTETTSKVLLDLDQVLTYKRLRRCGEKLMRSVCGLCRSLTFCHQIALLTFMLCGYCVIRSVEHTHIQIIPVSSQEVRRTTNFSVQHRPATTSAAQHGALKWYVILMQYTSKALLSSHFSHF